MPSITSATQIGLEWTDGLSNGGEVVVFYRLWYDQGSLQTWAILEPEVYSTSYTMQLVTTGTTYKFRVQARNSVGFSDNSNEVSILAGQVPD